MDLLSKAMGLFFMKELEYFHETEKRKNLIGQYHYSERYYAIEKNDNSEIQYEDLTAFMRNSNFSFNPEDWKAVLRRMHREVEGFLAREDFNKLTKPFGVFGFYG